MEFSKSDEEVLVDLLGETNFQPEVNGYYLVEVIHGMLMIECILVLDIANDLVYFDQGTKTLPKANISSKNLVPKASIEFSTNG